MSPLMKAGLGLGIAVAAFLLLVSAYLASESESQLGSLSRLREPSQANPQVRCPTPEGWQGHRMAPDETLEALASNAGIGVAELLAANCLTRDPQAGELIAIPSAPSASQETPCGPPPGWELIVPIEGENLTDIAARFGTTEAALRQANCLPQSSGFQPLARLYVPQPGSLNVTPSGSPTESPTGVGGGAETATPTP